MKNYQGCRGYEISHPYPIIHIHIHRFCVDIHGYIHIHSCLPYIDIACPQSTVGFYRLLVLKIYKSKNLMFAVDVIKDNALIKSIHMCTRTYMSVVVSLVCQTVFQHKKNRKMQQQKNRQLAIHLRTLLSQIFVLYFIFVAYPSAPYSSVPFFNSFSMTEIL